MGAPPRDDRLSRHRPLPDRGASHRGRCRRWANVASVPRGRSRLWRCRRNPARGAP